ncbi:MAG: hypothetical protein LBU27_03775 [Candidatus Peribacteria bacterium]|nr:hypothetical protein [Candidatus Peribacteria bacterium]
MVVSLFLSCSEQSETKTTAKLNTTTVVVDGKCSRVEKIVPEIIIIDGEKVEVYTVNNEKWCYTPHRGRVAVRIAVRLRAQFSEFETVSVSIGDVNSQSYVVFREKGMF